MEIQFEHALDIEILNIIIRHKEANICQLIQLVGIENYFLSFK